MLQKYVVWDIKDLYNLYTHISLELTAVTSFTVPWITLTD